MQPAMPTTIDETNRCDIEDGEHVELAVDDRHIYISATKDTLQVEVTDADTEARVAVDADGWTVEAPDD